MPTLQETSLMVSDWDTWEKTLDPAKRQQLDSVFRFETDKIAARQRFAAVAHVSAATGADIDDVSRRFESWYMPAFAVDAKVGFNKPEGVKDSGEFFGLLKGRADTLKMRNELFTDAAGAALESVLMDGNALDDFATWQAGQDHEDAYGDKALEVWKKAREEAQAKLGADGLAIAKRGVRAMRTETGVAQEGDAWMNEARRDLIRVKAENPAKYNLILGAMTRLGKAAPKSDKGVVEGMGEQAGRVLGDMATGVADLGTNMMRDASASLAGAGITNAENPEALAAQIRAGRDVDIDLEDLKKGVIDPIKSERDGWTGWIENAAYGLSSSAPIMAAARNPLGQLALAGMFADESYNDFRRAGWTGAGAAGAAVASGVFQTGVEYVSELAIKIPGVAGVMAKFGVKPGSSWAAQFFMRSGLRAGTELGEEAIQQATTPFIQEMGHAITDAIPDRPEGQKLKDVMSEFMKADQFMPLMLSVLPLGMMGAGMSTSQDMAVVNAVTSNDKLLRAVFSEEDTAAIIAEADPAKRQAMIQEKWVATPIPEIVERARAVMQEETNTLTEAREALATMEAAPFFLMPIVKRDENGWLVRYRGQGSEAESVVRVANKEAAVSLAYDGYNENVRTEARAMVDTLEAFAGATDIFEVDLANERLLKDTGISEEEMTKAAIAEGIINGLTREEAMNITWAVHGQNRLEQVEGVRRVVSNLARGANVLDAVEEPIEGKLMAAIKQGRLTREQAIAWVKVAADAMNAPELVTAAESNERGLIEAVSDVVLADVFGKRKDGSKAAQGAISAGIRAKIRRGEAGKAETQLGQILASFRHFFGQVFKRARQLVKARKDGRIGEDFDSFLDTLMETDASVVYEAEAAREAVEMASEVDNAPFSLSPRGMASDSGAAQNTEPTTGGLTESEGFISERMVFGYGSNKAVELYHGGPIVSNWQTNQERLAQGAFAGFHLTENLEMAERYAANSTDSKNAVVSRFYARIPKLWDTRWKQGTPPAFDSILDWQSLPETDGSKYRLPLYEDEYLDAIEAGFDGVISDTFLDDETGFYTGSQIVVFNPKSNLISINPESSRAEDGAFSLAPRSLASVADTVLASKMKKPEFREALYRVAREKMAKIRESMDTITGRITNKTEAEWQREMKAREGFEYDRLLRDNFGADTTKKQDALPVVDRQAARSEARTFAERWLEGEKKGQPTKEEKQKAALRTLDAILSAFDDKIRGRVGGFVQLAEAKTDAAREKEIIKRLEFLDKVVEQEARKLYLEKIEKAFERGRSKKNKSGQLESKLTPDAAEEVDFAYFFNELPVNSPTADIQSQDSVMAGLEKTIEESEDSDAVQAAIFKLGAAELFYDLYHKERDSAQLEAAAKWLEETISGARAKRKALEEARKAYVQGGKSTAIASLGKDLDASLTAAENTDSRILSKTWSRFMSSAKGLVNDILFTAAQQLENTFGDSAIAQEFTTRLIQAANLSTDIKREVEKRRKVAVARIFGTTNTIAQAAAVGKLQEVKASGVMVMVGAKMETKSIAVEALQRIIEGKAEAKAFGLDALKLDKLADAWAENDSLPANRQKKSLSFEVPVQGKPTDLLMSEDQGIQYLLWSRQTASREQMERDGWRDESFKQLDAFLSDEAKQLADFLAGEYEAGGDLIDPVYRRVFNAPMPRNRNYAPIYRNVSATDNMTPLEAAQQSSGLAAGFTKARNANARAALKRTSALAAFLAHVEHVSHWVAHAETIRDMKAVLASTEVQDAIRAAGGGTSAQSLKTRIKSIESQGNSQAWSVHSLNTFANQLNATRAFRGLAFRLSPIIKQTSALFNPLLGDVPAWAFLRGMGRLMAGKLDVSAMFNSDAIQRRVEQGFSPESRIAIQQLGMTNSALLAAMGKGMQPMTLVDASWTTAGAAIAFDFYRSQNVKAGMNPQLAENQALIQVDNMIAETAQPTDSINRSVIEGMNNPIVKGLMMFTSEPRKTLAIEVMAMRRLISGKSKNKAMDIQRVLVAHGLMAVTTQLMAGVLALLGGDDEDIEREWSVDEWAAALIAGPINGLFLLGDGVNYAIKRLIGARAFASSTPVGKEVENIMRAATNIDDLFNGDSEEMRKEMFRLSGAISSVSGALFGPANPITATDVILGNTLKEIDEVATRD